MKKETRSLILATIATQSSIPPQTQFIKHVCVDKENCTLYVPQGSRELYRTAEGWGEFVHIVEMEGTGINGLTTATNVFDVYDLSGRKVRTGVSSIDDLPKGIYIVKGKKMILR